METGWDLPRCLEFIWRISLVLPLGALLLLVLFTPKLERYPMDFVFPEAKPDFPFEMFIISAYFYPTSKSLGDNAVAMVLSGDQEAFSLSTISVVAWNETHNSFENIRLERITPHNVCRWISYSMIGHSLPNMERMALVLGKQFVEVPFRRPVYQKHEVVTCMAPLFANDQWQNVVIAAHTYKRFGSHIHLYVRSMATSAFNLLEEYEKEGYLTLQPWLRMQMKEISEEKFNPNKNVEFRNQAAAQTDCLLQYKESASFISFMDVDEILIPQMGKTYFEEFAFLFNSMPNTAFIHYSQQNAIVDGDFSSRAVESGKFVVRPQYVNTTWIHWPVQIPEGYEKYDVPEGLTRISDLGFLGKDEDLVKMTVAQNPDYNPFTDMHNSSDNLLHEEDIRWIQKDFERMKSRPVYQEIWKTLPSNFFYQNISRNCFTESASSMDGFEHVTCAGLERCNIPISSGINCSNSHADYHSTVNQTLLNIHFTRNAHFQMENGCRA